MSYIKTTLNKGIGICRYAYNEEDNIDPRTSEAFIHNKSYLAWQKDGTLNTDFKIHGTDYKNEFNNCNVALTTGITYGSNIIAIDIDDYKWDNKETHPFIKKFGKNYIELFNTYTQKTPSGGIHLLFKYNERISKTTGSPEYEIDIRSNGGVIMMAGSYSQKRDKYYECIKNKRIREMPIQLIEWLEEFIYGEKLTTSMRRQAYIGNNYNATSTYKYIISSKDFETIVVNNLDDKYFKDLEYWLKFITACKYLGFKDLAMEKSKPFYNNKRGDFTKNFNSHWNGIKKDGLPIIELLFKEVNQEKLIKLYRYKPTPKNIVEPDEIINIDKLGKTLNITEECMRGKCYVIKSDTGTGKTTLARNTIKEILEERDINFISIVSRIGLAEEQYNDFTKEGLYTEYYEKLFFKEGMNCVICLDSISKLKRVQNWKKYIIFADEINSLLKHLIMSPTIKNRPDIIELFIKIINECRAIIMTDADVSDKVFDFLKYTNRHFKYIQNTFIHNVNIKAIEIDNENEIITKIKNDDKYLVCCDSKTKAQAIYNDINDKETELYTSEDKLINTFHDIEKLIISPKCVYGQDASINRNVYGIYDGCSIGSNEMKQQVCRERKIKDLLFCFTNLQSRNATFANLEACIKDTQQSKDFIEKYFEKSSYDEKLEEIYTTMYNLFKYDEDCIRTNLRLHFINKLKDTGFNVVSKEEIKRKAKSKIEIKELSTSHKEQLFTKDNEEVKQFFKEYFIDNTEEFIEENLELFTSNNLKTDLFKMKYYYQLNQDLCEYYDCFQTHLENKINNLNKFDIEKSKSIENKFYWYDYFKKELNFRLNEVNEIIINDKLKEPQLFKDVMNNVFKLKVNDILQGYELEKSFYKMINNIFPRLYHSKQVKKNNKKFYKYYYDDKNYLVPLIKKMKVFKDTSIKSTLFKK